MKGKMGFAKEIPESSKVDDPIQENYKIYMVNYISLLRFYFTFLLVSIKFKETRNFLSGECHEKHL